MLNLSEILLRNPQMESFGELVSAVQKGAQTERFFRMDIRPPFPDTPSTWEMVLEAAFSAVLDTAQT